MKTTHNFEPSDLNSKIVSAVKDFAEAVDWNLGFGCGKSLFPHKLLRTVLSEQDSTTDTDSTQRR